MRRLPAIFALAAALMARPVCADTVDTTVMTLLAGHADPRDGQLHTVIPVYESLSLLATIQRPFTDGIRVVFSGWGGLLGEYPSQISWTGDIDLGYAEGSFFRRGLQLRLGRQLVFGGAARGAQLDGLHVTARILGGLHIAGYAGVPVTPRFGASRGDFIAGGRMFYRHGFDKEFGISFNQILAQGRVARQDLGLDARYVPHPTVALTGYALIALREGRLAELDLSALWLPRLAAQLAIDYLRTAPDLFLPLNSIFAVFSQESRDEVGAMLFGRPLRRLRLAGDYHTVITPDGVGHRGGARVSVVLGQHDHTTLNAELRLLKLPEKGYIQGRLFSVHRLSPAFIATIGLDSYFLDRPINGESYSFTANTSVGYEWKSGFRLALSGMADVTPFAERRFEFITRLAYNVVRRFREVSP